MKLAKVAGLTFAVVLIAVVGVAALAGMMTAETTEFDSPDHVEVDNPQFSADRISGDYTPGQADIQMDSNESSKKIVINTGLLVTEHDIQPLVSALVQEGHEVVIHGANQANLPVFPRAGGVSTQVGPPGTGPNPGGQQQQLGDRLEDAHAFVSIGVGNYPAQDIESIKEFANNDGRVFFAINPSQQHSFSQTTTNLYSKLGVYPESGYVYNMENNDQNYQRIFAEPTGESNLTQGLDRVMLSTATAVQTVSDTTLLRPTDGAQLSTTRAETNAPLMVRNDSTVLVGDSLFMTPANTLRADNDKFVGNIADFLVTGNRTLESEKEDDTTDTGEVVIVDVGPDGQPVFEPQELEIEPGTIVRFQWQSDGYNLVPQETPPGVEWEGVPQPKDEGFVYEFTFETEGVYVYVSEPHEEQGMIAGIIVGDP